MQETASSSVVTAPAVDDGYVRLAAVGKTYHIENSHGGETELEAIRQVDAAVPRGRLVAIVGPSGCGKSTLLEMVAGLRRPSHGTVLVDGRRVDGPHPSLGMVFQEESLFPWRTVLSNVEFPLEVAGMSARARQQRARELLALVGLAGQETLRPRELSGGMRQRVAIARALAPDPAILLMDEPFGALDQQTRLFLGGELVRIWARTHKTILFVTHDIAEAVFIAQEVWVMSYRPSTIIERLAVDLPHPRDVDLVTTPAFNALTNRVWGLLRGEAAQAFAAREQRHGHDCMVPGLGQVAGHGAAES
jgi:NitT/TauT family transport system ATP-binding protein